MFPLLDFIYNYYITFFGINVNLFEKVELVCVIITNDECTRRDSPYVYSYYFPLYSVRISFLFAQPVFLSIFLI